MWDMKMRGALLLLLAVCGTFATENVLHLTAETFDGAVQEHSFLAVAFHAPWCGHCKQLAPHWEEAATILKDNAIAAGYGIALAAVDATVHTSIAGRYSIQGYPTIKIFEGHSDATVYEGPRDAAGIVKFLLARAGPASIEITGEEEAASLLKHGGVVVVYAGAEDEWWLDIAKSKRDVVHWRHVTNEAAMRTLGVESGTITMLNEFEETSVVYKGEMRNLEKIIAFIDYHRFPVAVHIKKGDQETIKIVFEPDKKPNLFLFTNTKDDGLEEFTTAAQKVRGEFVSARFWDSDFGDAYSHFGLEKYIGEASLPKVLIEDRKNDKKYLLEGDVNEASIELFISEFQEGNLEPMP
jgi:protein disulfide isomerase